MHLETRRQPFRDDKVVGDIRERGHRGSDGGGPEQRTRPRKQRVLHATFEAEGTGKKTKAKIKCSGT